MKPGLNVVLALTFMQVPDASPAVAPASHFQLLRKVVTHGTGESCAVLDALVFAHAAPSLKDLRLLSSIGQIPYTITLSETAESTGEDASLVQTISKRTGIAFDLEMPRRPYTEVNLDLRQQNFVVKAVVSGMNDLSASTRTPLGTFTLFDLTSRHLSRNTILPLQESAFRFLHVELSGDRLLPSNIYGAQVPPSREAQTIYTAVATSFSIRQQASNTLASFRLPAHVPVERLSIALLPGPVANFSRKVRVTGHAASPASPVETVDGTINRVDLGKLQSRRMAFPAVMGINLQEDATIDVAIENGAERPLPISSITLEMRRRSICFNASTPGISLLYGDASLSAPAFAPAAPFTSNEPPTLATLGPETRNPAFQAAEQQGTLSGRRSDILWFVLLAGAGVGGALILRTLRRR